MLTIRLFEKLERIPLGSKIGYIFKIKCIILGK
jgi:hypothetical protein